MQLLTNNIASESIRIPMLHLLNVQWNKADLEPELGRIALLHLSNTLLQHHDTPLPITQLMQFTNLQLLNTTIPVNPSSWPVSRQIKQEWKIQLTKNMTGCEWPMRFNLFRFEIVTAVCASKKTQFSNKMEPDSTVTSECASFWLPEKMQF